MTLRIETTSDGQTATLRLIGRIESEHLDELQTQVRRHRLRLLLDLDEVTLVDVGVVRFLIAREAEGIELLNCAPYIREWMSRERERGE
jgi:anti-anti-sigma regulatory factor